MIHAGYPSGHPCVCHYLHSHVLPYTLSQAQRVTRGQTSDATDKPWTLNLLEENFGPIDENALCQLQTS